MKPLVSIVIPTYNRANDLRRALKSVLAQTYPHWEALVVDNDSRDHTDDVVKGMNDARIRIFKIHNDGVIAASRNSGIKRAVGKYIAFLDSDDWWMPEKLSVSLQVLEQGADVVYHDLFLVRKPNQKIFYQKARTRNLKSPVFNDLLANGNALNNSSAVIRKDFLSAIHGLSENKDLIALEDYDAWLKIAKLTEKFQKIHKTLGYYWSGGGNISNPAQLLKNLDTIEGYFAQEMFSLFGHHGISWLNYARGKTRYRLKSYEMAEKDLALVVFRRAAFEFKIKSIYMILMGRARVFFCSFKMRSQ